MGQSNPNKVSNLAHQINEIIKIINKNDLRIELKDDSVIYSTREKNRAVNSETKTQLLTKFHYDTLYGQRFVETDHHLYVGHY